MDTVTISLERYERLAAIEKAAKEDMIFISDGYGHELYTKIDYVKKLAIDNEELKQIIKSKKAHEPRNINYTLLKKFCEYLRPALEIDIGFDYLGDNEINDFLDTLNE